MLKEIRYYWATKVNEEYYSLVDFKKFIKGNSNFTRLSKKYVVGSDGGIVRILTKDPKFIIFFKSRFKAKLYKFCGGVNSKFKLMKVTYIGKVANQIEEA